MRNTGAGRRTRTDAGTTGVSGNAGMWKSVSLAQENVEDSFRRTLSKPYINKYGKEFLCCE